MSRLFTCGFEENDNTTTSVWHSVSGTATWVATAPHSGGWHLRVPSASNGVRFDFSSLRTSGTLFTRAYWRPETLPTSGTTTNILRIASSGGTQAWTVALVRATNVLRLTNVITTATVDTTAVMSVATWYRLEVRHLISDTVGEIELRVYEGDSTTEMSGGTVQLGAADTDTLPTNVGQFGFSNTSDSTGHVWFYDDIAINDDAGSFQNTWCGPGKVFLLTPNGDGATTDFTPTSGTNAENVDDVPGTPDDGTTQVSTSTSGHIDRLTLTSLGSEVTSDATIALAHVAGRVGGDGTSGTRLMRFKIWDEDGTLTDGTDTSLNDVSGWNKSGISGLVLDTSGKTKADFDSFEAGYEARSAHLCLVTALWVNVEWLEAAAAGDSAVRSRLLTLIGVGA